MDGLLNACRICLETENLLSIFEGKHDKSDTSIWAKIVYCASVQVSESDLLPKRICNQCLYYLDIAYTFKTMCETTDRKFRAFFTSKKLQGISNNCILENTLDECKLKEEHHNKEFTEREENIKNIFWQVKQTSTIDIESVISNPVDYQSRDLSCNYDIDKCESVNQCSLVAYKIDEQKDNINIDMDKDTHKDTLKVGRHIAKKNSGKFPQKLHATTTENKQDNTKDILEDVNYESECHIFHNFEGILESDLPVVGFEETVITDNNAFCFDVHKETSNFEMLEPANTKQLTKQFDGLKNDMFMGSKDEIADVISKANLKNKHTAIRRNKKVNVFDDRPIKTMKVKRTSQDLIKTVKIAAIKRSKQSFKCDVCGKAFPFKSHLERHINVHTGIKKFNCDYCQRKFINSYNLSVHILKHTDEFPLKCQSCNKGFANQSLLKRHEATHTSEATFQCRYCPVKLRQSSSLRLHEKMHLHRPSYHCDVCYKVFSYTNSLAAHKKQHFSVKRYTCDSCLNTFSRKSSLIRHIEGHHKTKRIKCKLCGELFNNKNTYNLHLKAHRHECGVCGDRFQHKTTFVHHMKTHKSILKCEQCFKVFSSKIKLVKHLKKHLK